MASSVGYIISCMTGPAKFCAPALVHKIPKTFIQNASLELILHDLPWTNSEPGAIIGDPDYGSCSELNVTWLCKQNHD